MFDIYYDLRVMDFQDVCLSNEQLLQYDSLHEKWMSYISESGCEILRSKYLHAHFCHYKQLHLRSKEWQIPPKLFANEGWKSSNKAAIFTYKRHSPFNGGGGKHKKNYIKPVPSSVTCIHNSIIEDLSKGSDIFNTVTVNNTIVEQNYINLNNVIESIIHPLLLPIPINKINFKNGNLLKSKEQQLQRCQQLYRQTVKNLTELAKYYQISINISRKENIILSILQFEQMEIVKLQQFHETNINTYVKGSNIIVLLYLSQMVQHLTVFEDFQIAFHNKHNPFYSNRISKTVIPLIIREWYNDLNINNIYTFITQLSNNLNIKVKGRRVAV